MRNNELSLMDRLRIVLEDRLKTLAAKWKVSPMTDERIADVRRSAENNILWGTEFQLTRTLLREKDDVYRAFFDNLSGRDYKAELTSTHIAKQSQQYADAVRVLRDFAYYVGVQANRPQKTMDNSRLPWVARGIAPTEHIVEINDLGRPTIPSGDVVNEAETYLQKRIEIQTIIDYAHPDNLKNYLEQNLNPYLLEIQELRKKCRQMCTSEANFMFHFADLSDHETLLRDLAKQAEQKLRDYSPAAITERAKKPELVNQPTEPKMNYTAQPAQQNKPSPAPQRVTYDAALEESAGKQMADFEAKIATQIANLQGAELLKFTTGVLAPKLAKLESDIATLTENGLNPQILRLKQRQLAIVQGGVNTAQEKELNGRLDILRARIDKNISGATYADLKAYSRDHLLPKRRALEAELAAIPAEDRESFATLTKQRHLDVIVAGVESARARMTELAMQSKPAALPVAVQQPVIAQPPAEKPVNVASKQSLKDAIFGLFRRDTPRMTKEMANAFADTLPVLTEEVSVPQAPTTAIHIPQPANQQAASSQNIAVRPQESKAIPPQRTSRDVSNATCVPFVEKTVKPAPKTSFWYKAATAFCFAAAAVVGSAAGFVMVAGQEHQAPDASKAFAAASGKVNAEPASAQSATLNSYMGPVFMEAPLATEKELKVAAKFDAATRAEPQVKATVAKAPVAKPAKAQKVTTPEAANTNEAKPAILASFDIPSSRIDLETWKNVCDHLKRQNMTVEGGVCPQ